MAEPVRVSGGSFRVDRKRALEKLGRFQYQNLNEAVAVLVRAAEASGARRIDLSFGSKGFRMRFDGTPLSDDEMRNPLDGIFLESCSLRARLLASGLLTLCHKAYAPGFHLTDVPGKVSLTSGLGRDRRQVLIDIQGDDETRQAADGGKDTRISALIRYDPRYPQINFDFMKTPLLSAKLTLNGLRRPRLDPRTPGLWFRTRAVRGFVGLPLMLGWRPGRLHVSYLGVESASRRFELPVAQVESWVDDARAQTDLSGAIADSSRWRKLERLVLLESLRLVRRLAAEQPVRLRHAWRMLADDAVARDVWRRRDEWGPLGDPDALGFAENLNAAFSGGNARRTRFKRLLWTAHVTWWLRELVERHVAPRGSSAVPRGVLAALRDAPIALGCDGSQWSFAALQARPDVAAVRTARFLDSRGIPGSGSPAPIWCPAQRDASWLRILLG